MPKKPELSAADQALREAIGSAIRLASASKNCKPVDVAKAGGVSLAHQYRIENGERSADALYLVKVARHLGISVDDLVTTSEAHHPEQRSAVGVVQTNSGSGVVQAGRDANGATINTGSTSKSENIAVKSKGGFLKATVGKISINKR